MFNDVDFNDSQSQHSSSWCDTVWGDIWSSPDAQFEETPSGTASSVSCLGTGEITQTQLDDSDYLKHVADPAVLGTFGPGGPSRRVTAAFLAVVGVGLGCATQVASGVGGYAADGVAVKVASTWSVPVFLVSLLVVLLMVLLAVLLGQRPGAGTLVVSLFAPLVFGLAYPTLPSAHSLVLSYPMFIVGTVMFLVSAATLVAVRLGASPGDLVSLGLSWRRVFGRTLGVARARVLFDGLFVLLAVLVGAPLGAGTLILAVVSGPLLRLFIPWMSHVVFGPLTETAYPTQPIPEVVPLRVPFSR